MARTTSVTCVCCPRGCSVQVDETGAISGNGCRNGAAYARQQLRDPKRRITGEVRVHGGTAERCRVKTDRSVDTQALGAIEEALCVLTLEAPVYVSQVLVRDFCSTGANLVSCENIGRKK